MNKSLKWTLVENCRGCLLQQLVGDKLTNQNCMVLFQKISSSKERNFPMQFALYILEKYGIAINCVVSGGVRVVGCW